MSAKPFAQFNAHGLNIFSDLHELNFTGYCRETFGKERVFEFAIVGCHDQNSYVVKKSNDKYNVYTQSVFNQYFKRVAKPSASTLGEAGFHIVEKPRP